MKKYIVLIILLFALPFNLQATQISTKQIKDKAITTAKLDDSAVDDTKLEAVLKAKIPTADEKAAMTNASSPDAGNPFATTSDIDDKLDVADSALFIWKDGSQDFTADQSMDGFSLTNMDEPAADSEAATKYYVDQGLAGKLDDTEDVVRDTHINWGTGTGQVSGVDLPIADAGDFFTAGEVEAALQELSKVAEVANGSTLRPIALSVASDGSDITASLSSAVGNTITYKFSDGQTAVDVSTPDTAILTEGTDAIPVMNYLYVLQTDPTTLVKSTTGWPATEYYAVGKVICQSAVTLQGDGPLKQHTWQDSIAEDTTIIGHMAHINAWVRNQWGTWDSGVAPTFSGTGTGTIGYASTSGEVRQLHLETFPTFNDGADVYCVDDADTSYRKITNIADLLKDNTGTVLKNKTYGLVFWGAVSDDGQSKVFVNLPSGSELGAANARQDNNKYINYSIPVAYKGVGFLIYRLIIKNNNDTTWTLYTGGSGDDLRGQFPNVGAGSSTAFGVIFPDGASGFTLFNTADITKQVQVTLAGIMTGNTRTITFPDADVDLGDIATNTAGLNDKLDIADSALFVWKDGSQDFTADQSMGGFKITSANEATADSDYMTKWGTDQLLADKLDIADSPVIDDTAYNATSWDSNSDAATKNAIRDKIETMNTAIGLNTAKDTNVSTQLSEGTRDDTTYGITSDGGADDILLPQANTNEAGLLSGTKWDEIVANTAKDTNVSTELSVGTVGENTVAITSDGGADDVTLPAATNSTAGMLTTAKWGEIVANNAKNTNVSTALSEGTRDDTTYGITSDGGADDLVLPQANTNEAGLLSGTKWDEIVANTAKANSLTRYLHWSPAYDGYALSADGGNNDAGDSGILVAFAGTLGDSDTTDTPYIEWASTTAGVNDYDVIIKIPIPADYSSMGTFRVEYDSDTVLEDTATVYLYDSNDAADSSVVLSSSAWAVDEMMSPSGTYTAGEHMTIKLHLECAQNQKMRVGEIRCSYTATR